MLYFCFVFLILPRFPSKTFLCQFKIFHGNAVIPLIYKPPAFSELEANGNIRGYYSGMETEDMSKLKKDIKSLLRES